MIVHFERDLGKVNLVLLQCRNMSTVLFQIRDNKRLCMAEKKRLAGDVLACSGRALRPELWEAVQSILEARHETVESDRQ